MCTQYDCFNSQNFPGKWREKKKKKKERKHTRKLESIVLYLSGCISLCSFYFILIAKAKQTEITTTKM